jgi:hypothetical protein
VTNPFGAERHALLGALLRGAGSDP